MKKINVVIPTLSRHAGLVRAINSIEQQVVPDDVEVEVVIVDNSATGDAKSVVAQLSLEKVAVTYISEPHPGIANARNAGVSACSGQWIAFLDDDETACEKWLSAMLTVAESTSADAVFGPVEAEGASDASIGRFAKYFCREIDGESGLDITSKAAYLGTNNSMFHRERCLDEDLPFDPKLNSIGGEDSLLLKRLVQNGRKLAWAPDAMVTETVPERRLNWAYVRKRKFLSGQIRVFVHHMIQPVRWSRICLWMAVGFVQCCIGFLGATLLRPFKREAAEELMVVGFAGLGKMFWMPSFRPKLYGSGHVS